MKKEKFKSSGCRQFSGSNFGIQNRIIFFMVSVYLLLGAITVFAEEDNKEKAPNTVGKDFGWCVLTCPATCSEGKEFEIKLDLKHLKDISRNWEANKLAVHLFWSSDEKWGGYLCPFKSVGVDKDGEITMKGKFTLNEKIKSQAAYVHVKAVLTSDWTNQDEQKAADLMGPRIKILK